MVPGGAQLTGLPKALLVPVLISFWEQCSPVSGTRRVSVKRAPQALLVPVLLFFQLHRESVGSCNDWVIPFMGHTEPRRRERRRH